jgi:hypothetical protein
MSCGTAGGPARGEEIWRIDTFLASDNNVMLVMYVGDDENSNRRLEFQIKKTDLLISLAEDMASALFRRRQVKRAWKAAKRARS